MDIKLLDDFFTESSSTYSEQNNTEFTSEIRLNPQHPVYAGHFEELPVAPGVCLTQVVKEVLMSKLQRALLLQRADNIKFLALINPNDTSEFTITFSLRFDEKTVQVNASYTNSGTTYMKFKGSFALL